MNRREFIVGSGAILAAPYVLRKTSFSQTPAPTRVRRRLSSLSDTDPFFSEYAEAIQLMHQEPSNSSISWRAFSIVHADHCAHGDLEFLTWHRAYLNFFENTCGKLIGNPSFALPYWDWSDNNGRLPAPFFEQTPLNVVHLADQSAYNSTLWGQIDTVPFRFAKPDRGLRDDPRSAGSFTETRLADIQNESDFALFSDLLEGPHGTAHVFVGGGPALGTQTGHMSFGMSPLDPIFWLHHANVDRMWAKSSIPTHQQIAAIADPSKIYSGMFIDKDGNDQKVSIEDTFILSNFGYTYDFLQESDQLIMLESQEIEASQNLPSFTNGQDISNEIEEPEKLSLGQQRVSKSSVVGAITRIDVKVDNLLSALTSTKLLQKQTARGKIIPAIKPKRVFATIEGVRPLEGSRGNEIKVFVNCPYLSDATSTADKHFAGVVNFFGCIPERCAPKSFTIELTQALQKKLAEGTLDTSQLEVQLLPQDGGNLSAGLPVASLEGVRIFAV